MEGENRTHTLEGGINKVAVRVPPFWSDEPELWFAQLESQFTISGITQDSTKYFYALSQLESRHVREIKDVITQPPENNKYEMVKKTLIQRVSISQEQRTRQLLELEELGDHKPSQFLRHLRTLAGEAIPDALLRTLWLGRLPTQMQLILATRTEDHLNSVAEQADRIHEMSNKTPVVAAASSSPESLETQMVALTKKVATLTTRLARKKTRRGKQERGRSRSRSKDKDHSICFYHRQFGDKAKKCTKPCNYKPEKE